MKENKDNNILTMLKGMIIGATMLVPGVSGGSMAMLLSVYDRLISAVSSFQKDKKGNLMFLALFSVAGGLGMVLFANPLLELIGRYPMPTRFFFVGAVAGGIPFIFREAKVRQFSWKVPCAVIAGLLMVLFFSAIPVENVRLETEGGVMGTLFLLIAGFIAAIALVLPGISVSYLLLLLGIYDATMEAISALKLSFLIPLGVGVLLGIFLTTKILEQAMEKYRQTTYLMILGFVLGSVVEVFPGIPSASELVLSVLMLFLGFSVIQWLAWKEKKLASSVEEIGLPCD